MSTTVLGIFLVVWCYILGSLPLGYWLVRSAKGIDVRDHGSGNIGMTNVWRVAGAQWGMAVLILDIAKGSIAAWVPAYFFSNQVTLDELRMFTSLAVLGGTLFSIFLKFKGGKGVGVSIGVFFVLVPQESAAALAIFLLILYLTRMVSVSSICGVTFMALYTTYRHSIHWTVSWLALAAAAMVWYSHRENLKRVAAGAEGQISEDYLPGPGFRRTLLGLLEPITSKFRINRKK